MAGCFSHAQTSQSFAEGLQKFGPKFGSVKVKFFVVSMVKNGKAIAVTIWGSLGLRTLPFELITFSFCLS